MDISPPTVEVRPRRRRALLWALFGLIGIVMSAAWSSGFSTSDSGAAGTGPAQDVFGAGGNPAQSLSDYASVATNPADLAITFDGQWGQIADDTLIFEVNLTDAGFAGRTFYVDIYVDNAPFVNPWTAAQIKWLQFEDCDTATPNAAAYDAEYAIAASNAAGDPKIMNIIEADAYVSFPGLAAGDVYCFGISESDLAGEPGEPLHADDPTGTFLTRPDSGVVPDAPDFVVAVNHSA